MIAGLLALTVFVATAVEVVEALITVLAAGVGQSWRSTLRRASAAIALLAVPGALFSDALTTEVPLRLLRFVMGLTLPHFSPSWLSKAVLRTAGKKPYRDEAVAFNRLVGLLLSLFGMFWVAEGHGCSHIY